MRPAHTAIAIEHCCLDSPVCIPTHTTLDSRSILGGPTDSAPKPVCSHSSCRPSVCQPRISRAARAPRCRVRPVLREAQPVQCVALHMAYEEVDIDDMDFDEENGIYTYECPCGDLFQITEVRVDSVLLGVDTVAHSKTLASFSKGCVCRRSWRTARRSHTAPAVRWWSTLSTTQCVPPKAAACCRRSCCSSHA
jgi:hypothetical protein